MHGIRRKIKDEFIADLGINPRDYDRKRGVGLSTSRDEYKNDEFDGIVITIANELLKVRKDKEKGAAEQGKVLDVFWCLYSCYSVEETCEYVLVEGQKGELKPSNLDTVTRYMRTAVKAVKESIQNDTETKEEIRDAIKRQYYGDDQADKKTSDN